ncbi:MAG: Xaa-Pro aminopeptidase, partial [Erysipelotrichaceae bacterium]|nr:Xaa-Pro aminopeptidase [Erysipelotrichaceae bacterium]
KLGETDAPEYLKKALHDVNEFQDICISKWREGVTGNEILKEALEEGFGKGLRPCLYTHPIGNHGHAAGPTVGLYDMQGGVPVKGDYQVHNNTAYSLELNCTVTIEEWNNTTFTLGLETDILFKDGVVYYLGGRQTDYHLIK